MNRLQTKSPTFGLENVDVFEDVVLAFEIGEVLEEDDGLLFGVAVGEEDEDVDALELVPTVLRERRRTLRPEMATRRI